MPHVETSRVAVTSERGARAGRVVIAGQMPPPIGGQTINIKRIYDLLIESGQYEVCHWDHQFSREINAYRKVNLRKIWELFRVILGLCRLRQDGPIDWILYPSGGPHRAPILKDVFLLPFTVFLGKRVVIHFQAAGLADALPSLPWWIRGFQRFAYKLCWGAVVLTNFGRRDALESGLDRIAVIPNAVEDANLEERTVDPTANPVILLNVGHLCPDKGTPALLEAFAGAARKHDHLKLRLVGECLGAYTEATLRNDIARLGLEQKVELAGLLQGEKLSAQYREASLFVFPSVAPYESFGLVLAEAMMWGLPVVVSDWRANAEVAGSECGGIVYKIGENHTASLQDALEIALAKKDQWTEWGEKNRASYKARFTTARFLRDWLNLFSTDSAGSAKNI